VGARSLRTRNPCAVLRRAHGAAKIERKRGIGSTPYVQRWSFEYGQRGHPTLTCWDRWHGVARHITSARVPDVPPSARVHEIFCPNGRDQAPESLH